MTNHTWKLVAPWYRWQQPGLPSAGRVSRPVIQKYDGATFVDEFLKNPQRSLKFTSEDLVHKVVNLPPLVPPFYKGKRRLSESGYVPTSMRKLFLDTHKRFYLVVCELHCDMPGFPSVERDQACEAGFVIRRRVVANLSSQALEEAQSVFKRLAQARQVASEYAMMKPENQLALLKKGLAPQGEAMLTDAIAASLDKNHSDALAQLAIERENLKQWADKFQVGLQLQGWKQLRDGIGEWSAVAETPQAITEQVFNLYPLIPDPRDEKHSAKGRTIYFGVVITGSSDTTEFGKARFDDTTQLEVRCFVRRHKANCPKRSQKPDCHGELVWSAPTEVYRLASHFDLVGTSNRPVSMQLPDLKALEAQAAALPPNQLAPFRMVAPPDSTLEVSADEDGNITSSSRASQAQICSFAIPLITIVATFVFKLFLPVVTLLFGLFFLLKLKFCIPPSVELSADIALELNATLEFGVDVDVDVSVDAKLDMGVGAEFKIGNEIDAKLRAGFGNRVVDSLKGGFGPLAVAGMTNDIFQSGQEVNAPSLTARLEFEAEVEAEVVR
ncbi:MAG TPA: hypothetical protein VKA70_11685 [Blastocatellia bacterium]|nr:hypothetical protein [Blastocatellia bacterium]